jgi:DNA primase
MNEGVLPHNKEELMSHATKYILYDNDDSGIKATEKVMKDIDIIPVFLPVSLAKDIDEVRVNYGEETTRKILNILLHTSNGNSNIYQHPKWEAMAAGV